MTTVLYRVVLSFLFICAVASSVSAQTERKYRNHEVIDVGNGQKVEILRSRGEGPLEEYDVIYYTDKRQLGTRMWQNAARLREEERAAILASEALKAPSKTSAKTTTAASTLATTSTKSANSNNLNVAKTRKNSLQKQDTTAMVPVVIKDNETGSLSIKQQLPTKEVATKPVPVLPPLSLEEVARQSDSIARAKTVGLDTVSAAVIDSAEMDKIFIPKNHYKAVKDADTAKDTSAKVEVAKEDVKSIDTSIKATVDTVAKIADTTVSTDISLHPNFIPHRDKINAESSGSDKATNAKNDIKDSAIATQAVPNSVDPASTIVSATKPTINAHARKKAEKGSKSSRELKNKSSTQTARATQSGIAVVDGNVLPSTLNAVEITKTETTAEPSAKTTVNLTNRTADNTASRVVTGSKSSAANIPEKTSPASDKATTGAAKTENATVASNEFLKTAEVNVDGSWEKAVIVDKESEYLYKVHYAESDNREDEWVAVSQIRNIDSIRKFAAATQPAVKNTKVNSNNNNECSFVAPAGVVTNADKFSDKLAKRKIYESYSNSKSKSSSKIGVSFLVFQTEEPFVNAVSVSETHGLQVKYSLAPAGALIYPVRTKIRLCELTEGKISGKVIDSNFSCYRDSKGAWVCTVNK